jgi:hypothetical protein
MLSGPALSIEDEDKQYNDEMTALSIEDEDKQYNDEMTALGTEHKDKTPYLQNCERGC